MAQSFVAGERKIRSGVYFRYENYGQPPLAGADDGRCAAVGKASWGPVGKVQVIENYADAPRLYGNSDLATVITEQFAGGARTVFAARIGVGGTRGIYQILDTVSTPVIQMTMLYPGKREFSVTIRPTLENPDVGELLLLDGTTALERHTFDISVGADQVASLIAALDVTPSAYYTLTKLADSMEAIANVEQAAVTPGTDPVDTGGTAGTYDIQDSANTSVIHAVAKLQGAIPYTFTTQAGTAADTTDFIIKNGTTVLETFNFASATGADQVANLLAAAANSTTFTFTKLADSANAIATMTDQAITQGTEPTGYGVNSYSAAFELLEAYRWNVLAIDSNDPAAHIVMQLYLDRIYEGGKFVMGVVGEGADVSVDTRITHASAFNDYQVVYVGNGFIDATGAEYDGWKAAARIAGLIAGTPSNETVTHLAITGAVDIIDPLTNYQYEQAILAGMLTFSFSAANTVWVEQGINTLVVPGTNDDEGWKKIKRVKVRFELMQRLTDTVDTLTARVNNDPDGRMTVIQAGNGVCDSMVAEGKLLAGAHVELDPANPPQGDSAWFLVYADDVDALEKLYFNFQFRFSPDAV